MGDKADNGDKMKRLVSKEVHSGFDSAEQDRSETVVLGAISSVRGILACE